MTTLTIDRLHARYLVDRRSVAERLDACLRRVVAEELDRELIDVGYPSAEHICVPDITVSVWLDPQAGTASAAQIWSRAIMAALRRRIGEGTGVVVYRRTLDALVDLVVSLGRGEAERAWAWRQVGLVGAATPVTPPGVAVAGALAAHPELAPAALTAAAARGPILLTADGWVAVARAVQRLTMAPDRQLTTLGGEERRATQDDTAPGYVVDLVLGAPVGRRLPDADLPPQDCAAVARLAVLCAVPALARSATVVAAVAQTMAGWRAGGLPADERCPQSRDQVVASRDAAPSGAVDNTRRTGRPIPAPAASAAAATLDADPTAMASPAWDAGVPSRNGGVPSRDGSEPEAGSGPGSSGVTSAVGGALFLVRIVTDLDLVTETGVPGVPLADRPFPWVVSQLAVRLTGASPEDPAILALGVPRADTDLAPPGVSDAQDAALAALTERIQAWLRRQLGLQVDDDLDWLWRRPASIAAEPGWIEAVFSLDDVDTRVRVTGLDLDPGFVWWLGALVRFHYV